MRRRTFLGSGIATLSLAALSPRRLYAAQDLPAVSRTGKAITLPASDIADLRARLRGMLLSAGDAGYDAARRIWNGAFDRKPALIAHCAGAADVMRTVEFVRAHGGVPIMAHPVPARAQNLDPFRLSELLPELKRHGLAGIECYYGEYDANTVRHLVSLANRLSLIPAGGSDFHGPNMGAGLGSTGLPTQSLARLRAARI